MFGKALVVAEGDVEARLQPLDEIEFEQQRFGFGRRGHEQHLRRLGDHARDAVVVAAGFGVGADALLQALGLADIEHVALGTQHAIDARRIRQRLQIGLNARGAFQGRSFRFSSFGIVAHVPNIILRCHPRRARARSARVRSRGPRAHHLSIACRKWNCATPGYGQPSPCSWVPLTSHRADARSSPGMTGYQG